MDDEIFDLNKIRSLSDMDMIYFLNTLYSQGYSEGHRHTVESTYQDVLISERGSYFHDEVGQCVIEYF